MSIFRVHNSLCEFTKKNTRVSSNGYFVPKARMLYCFFRIMIYKYKSASDLVWQKFTEHLSYNFSTPEKWKYPRLLNPA